MKPLQVYLPEAFIKHLKQKALNDGCSVSDLVRDALGADNDVLLTNKVVVPKVIKEPIKQPEKPSPEGKTITTPHYKVKATNDIKPAPPTFAPYTAAKLEVKPDPKEYKFPPSAASGVIKTPEDAKKATESPTLISKSYSARKKGSKERHIEL